MLGYKYTKFKPVFKGLPYASCGCCAATAASTVS